MAHEHYQSVIETLHECMLASNHCYDACLKEEHVGIMAEYVLLDRECADICGYLEQAIVRGTPFMKLAEVCAKICEACGIECENHDHEHCQKCAVSCFKCADACRQLIA